MGRPFIDRTGDIHGRLTILEYIGTDKYNNRVWKCKCECGNETTASWRELSRGHKQSCGCLFREHLSTISGWNRKPHGESSLNQLFYLYKKSAKQRHYEFSLTLEEFKDLVFNECYYCGESPSLKIHTAKGTNGTLNYTGVDRIDNSKGYILGNVRPCCKQCNFAKNGLSEDDFFKWLKKACENLKIKKTFI
jgi:hypothetical protein